MQKTVFITGGTSGFGLETAKAFHRAGYRVIIAARNRDKIEETVSRFGFDAGYTLDVTKYEQWSKVRENVNKTLGVIDILINNAGGGVKIAPIQSQTKDTIEEAISLNLTSAIYGTNVFAPDMIKKKDGFIINVSSVGARHNWQEWSLYCCAKAGLRSFTETLYKEMQPFGVRVTCVMPGGAITGFQKSCNINENPESLTAKDVAREILHCVMQPKGVLIKEITVCGTLGIE